MESKKALFCAMAIWLAVLVGFGIYAANYKDLETKEVVNNDKS